MNIGIGIDTGGTYTDAVIYDFDSRDILASGKAPTTKEDLSVGISNAMDKLPFDLLKQAVMIGLSTTMATNACVEGKGGRAKLIFWGVAKHTIESYGQKFGLDDVDKIYFQESYSSFGGEYTREPDWDAFIDALDENFSDCDAVGITEVNAMKTDTAVEKKSKQIVQDHFHIPVVCGSELFSDINVVQRGASTLLNARLIPLIHEFIRAIKVNLTKRGLDIPLAIVRSDCSLMNEAFTNNSPVETILCGPAASVMGGAELSGEEDALIIDMGGTTTDIAIVKDGIPVRATDGIQIGQWRTFVKGVYIHTFALGGDSAIRVRDDQLVIDDDRVVPLCVVSQRYPAVKDQLKELLSRKRGHTRPIHEFYMLVKDVSESDIYTPEEREFCRVLKDGPLIVQEAAAAVGKDIYSFSFERLEKEGVIIRCGMTPTDVMHIRGDFSDFDSEASLLGARQLIFSLDKRMTVEKFCEAAYTEVKRKMYTGIVKTLLQYSYPTFRRRGFDEQMEMLIAESFREAMARERGEGSRFLAPLFHMPSALVGIGAPIAIFLPDVAKLLGTRAVITEHYEVANAVGAVIGNVMATVTGQIVPQPAGGYRLFLKTGYAQYDTLEEATEVALVKLRELAREEAISRGAVGEISFTEDISGQDKETNRPFIDSTISVTAISRIRSY